MYFWVRFQTYAYAILYFLSFHQDSYYKYHLDYYHLDFRLNVFMWFSFRTYFIIFLQDYFIHWMINNRIVLLMYVKFISSRRVMTAVLSRPGSRILRNKVSQDLSFFWWMSEAMDEISVFGSIFRMIYKGFPALTRSLIRIGLSSWRGVLSSHFPAVASTVGIFPSRVFIRGLHNSCMYIFWYFHAFKHFKILLKINVFTMKSLKICLIAPDDGHTI